MTDQSRSNLSMVVQVLVGVIMLVVGGLLAWGLNVANTNAREIALLKKDVEIDQRQDAALRKHWTIVSRHRDWINELRQAEGMPMVSWPALPD